MSIKFYNKHAQQWQKIASLLANSVTVFDVEGNYDSQTVEGCLQEIADALNNRFDDVECTSNGVLNFYSNGVIVKSVNTPTTRSGGTVSDAIIKELQRQLDDHEQRISWLEENGADLTDSDLRDSTISGCMIYSDPRSARINIEDYIKNKM